MNMDRTPSRGRPVSPPVLLTEDHRKQVANWRLLVVVLAVAFFAQSIAFGVSVWTSAQSRQEDQAITTCRAKNAAALSKAQVDNDLAFDGLLLALSDRERLAAATPGTNPLQLEITAISSTAQALADARDARVAFEEHPTSSC